MKCNLLLKKNQFSTIFREFKRLKTLTVFKISNLEVEQPALPLVVYNFLENSKTIFSTQLDKV